MNPFIIAVTTLVGVIWLTLKDNTTPKTVVAPSTAASTNPLGGEIVPIVIPGQTPASPAAQAQASQQPNAIAPPGDQSTGSHNPRDSNVPYYLSHNMSPFMDIPKNYANSSLARGHEPGTGESGGSSGGCGCGSGCSKGSCMPATTISTQYTDGSSCMSSSPTIQQAKKTACNPKWMNSWAGNIRSSQGGSGAGGLAGGSQLRTIVSASLVNPVQQYAQLMNTPGYAPAFSQDVLNSEQGAILGGEDPSAAFLSANQQLQAIQAYSSVQNWNAINNAPANLALPFVSPAMAQQAIQNGTGVTGIDPSTVDQDNSSPFGPTNPFSPNLGPTTGWSPISINYGP